MLVKKVSPPKNFEPITVELTIEAQEELITLLRRLDIAPRKLDEISLFPRVESHVSNHKDTEKFFEALRDLAKARGIL